MRVERGYLSIPSLSLSLSLHQGWAAIVSTDLARHNPRAQIRAEIASNCQQPCPGAPGPALQVRGEPGLEFPVSAPQGDNTGAWPGRASSQDNMRTSDVGASETIGPPLRASVDKLSPCNVICTRNVKESETFFVKCQVGQKC